MLDGLLITLGCLAPEPLVMVEVKGVEPDAFEQGKGCVVEFIGAGEQPAILLQSELLAGAGRGHGSSGRRGGIQTYDYRAGK